MPRSLKIPALGYPLTEPYKLKAEGANEHTPGKQPETSCAGAAGAIKSSSVCASRPKMIFSKSPAPNISSKWDLAQEMCSWSLIPFVPGCSPGGWVALSSLVCYARWCHSHHGWEKNWRLMFLGKGLSQPSSVCSEEVTHCQNSAPFVLCIIISTFFFLGQCCPLAY